MLGVVPQMLICTENWQVHGQMTLGCGNSVSIIVAESWQLPPFPAQVTRSCSHRQDGAFQKGRLRLGVEGKEKGKDAQSLKDAKRPTFCNAFLEVPSGLRDHSDSHEHVSAPLTSFV